MSFGAAPPSQAKPSWAGSPRLYFLRCPPLPCPPPEAPCGHPLVSPGHAVGGPTHRGSLSVVPAPVLPRPVPAAVFPLPPCRRQVLPPPPWQSLLLASPRVHHGQVPLQAQSPAPQWPLDMPPCGIQSRSTWAPCPPSAPVTGLSRCLPETLLPLSLVHPSDRDALFQPPCTPASTVRSAAVP